MTIRNRKSKNLFPAVLVPISPAGDCRAVLASRSSSGKIVGLQLSNDHNSREPDQKHHLEKNHPGERDIVVCKSSTACYVKGRLQPTRAFGDGHLKLSEFNSYGSGLPGVPETATQRRLKPPYTPPYITATPEVIFWLSALDLIVLSSNSVRKTVDSIRNCRCECTMFETRRRTRTKCSSSLATESGMRLRRSKLQSSFSTTRVTRARLPLGSPSMYVVSS